MLGSALAACRATVDFAQAYSQLQRINPAIAGAETGVGDMHVAEFHAPIAVIAKEMCPQSNAGREVHTRSSGRHVVVGK